MLVAQTQKKSISSIELPLHSTNLSEPQMPWT
jgi:hypothetical protein